MKKQQLLNDQMVLLLLASVKFLTYILVNTQGGYGLFRDAFYYLACANFPDWGYVDQPPLSIIVLLIWRFFFGDSLFSIRFLLALLGACVVFFTGNAWTSLIYILIKTIKTGDAKLWLLFAAGALLAGANDYYRHLYHLPPAICGHNNYYLWGTRGQTGEVLIIFGGHKKSHERIYHSQNILIN
ncbi:hypothetical protein JXA70_11200 [candidate division KSB1 bacterium]|nr:hypothetical protein [candidate division KSB1 bacterium]